MPSTGFLPRGRIRDEFRAAADLVPSTTWLELLNLSDSVVLSRSLTVPIETMVQDSWDSSVRHWFPDATEAVYESCNSRPTSFPVPLVMSRSCTVDYLRLVKVASHGRLPSITAVAELKRPLYHPADGVPQALVAAFSAVMDLQAKGLPASDCVVPFIVYTGALEEHGVAYLAGRMPCAVMTTPVLDLSDRHGANRIAAARWAFVKIAERTESLLRALPAGRAGSPVHLPPSLDGSLFFWKRPLAFVGPTAQHSVAHQLSVFSCLQQSPAAADVVEPVAVLMQEPPVLSSGGSVPVSEADLDSGIDTSRATRSRVRADSVATTWCLATTIVFPRLDGFITGVPPPGHAHRDAVLAALRLLLRRLHGAGIVHMDLFSSNILWHADVNSTTSSSTSSTGTLQELTVRLVDFDAALFVGQLVPPAAATIVDQNGHTGSFHPEALAPMQRAKPDFDWWHFSLLSDDTCPFSVRGSPPHKLHSWLEGKHADVLRRVTQEVSDEAAAISLLSVAVAPST